MGLPNQFLRDDRACAALLLLALRRYNVVLIAAAIAVFYSSLTRNHFGMHQTPGACPPTVKLDVQSLPEELLAVIFSLLDFNCRSGAQRGCRLPAAATGNTLSLNLNVPDPAAGDKRYPMYAKRGRKSHSNPCTYGGRSNLMPHPKTTSTR